MTPLTLTLTDAGFARLRAASGTNALTVVSLGLSDRAFAPAPTLTALPGEHRRIGTLSGEAVDDRTIHLVARDETDASYTVRGIGLWLSDGTLFAVYSQAEAIFEKAAVATYYQALDIRLDRGDAPLIRFGDANFLLPPATPTRQGVVAIATPEQAQAGVDQDRAIVPSVLKTLLDVIRGRRVIGTGLATGGGDLSADRAIDVPAASAAEADAGTLTTKALVPASLANILVALGDRVRPSRRITTAGLMQGGGALTADLALSVPAASAAQLRAALAGDVALTPASFGGLQQVLGPTGSYTLPGGLVLKWGNHRGRATSEITVPVVFDQPFATACFVALPVPYLNAPSGSDDYFCQRAGPARVDGFTVQYQSDDANGGLDGFDWIALGN